MEMHKLLALVWFHLMGGMGVCWALSQTECFWQISWKYTMSCTTDEGSWHSSYSITVRALKLHCASVRECLLLFVQHLIDGVLDNWEGLGVAGLHLVWERWHLALVNVTPLLCFYWRLLALLSEAFFSPLAMLFFFFLSAFNILLSPLFCLWKCTGTFVDALFR